MNYKELKKEFKKKDIALNRADTLRASLAAIEASKPKTTGNLTTNTWSQYNRKN